jgi:hypothetical protein
MSPVDSCSVIPLEYFDMQVLVEVDRYIFHIKSISEAHQFLETENE